MTIMSRKALATAIAAAMIALTVTACSQGYLGPDPAACKAAMQAQYLKSLDGKARFGAALPVCKGLPEAELRRFAQQIRAGN
jgi:hypothetical protein